MRVTFQADADLDARILRGLKRLAPEIDIRGALQAGFTALPDIEVLRFAAAEGRVLVSQDRRTMPGHFRKFLEKANSPGVILLREGITISSAIDELTLIWSASDSVEWTNRLVWIPL
jgi:predicted nuclease of predicted toxin-antitoxin system